MKKLTVSVLALLLILSGSAVNAQVPTGGSGGSGGNGTTRVWDGTDVALVNAGGELLVTCSTCSGSGVSHIDNAAFTKSTDDVVPMAVLFDDTSPGALTEDRAGVARGSSRRELYTQIRDSAGNERGALVTAQNELLVELGAGSAAIGTVTVTDGAGALNVIVDSGTTAVTNAGTFVVQENGAALTALSLIDDTVFVAGTNTYTEATSKGNLLLGVRRDADTTLVDTTNEFGPLQLNAGGQLKVAVVGTLTVASHAVTNAGTFATQVDGAALTALNLIDDLPNTIGSTTSGQKGALMMGAVTTSAPTYTTAQTHPLSLDTTGALRVVGSSGTTQYTEDVAATDGAALVAVGAIRRDTTPSSSANAAGDNAAINVDANGRVYVQAVLYDAAGAALTIGSDSTLDAAVGTTGPLMVARGSSATPTAMSTNGDATAVWSDLFGRLHAVWEGVEDAAETAGGFLSMIGSVRRDAPVASASDGENATVNTNAYGAVWVSNVDPCSSETKVNVAISLTADTVVIPAVSAKKNYICAIDITAAAAEIVSITEGTGATCGTGEAAIMGSTTDANGASFAANGGMVKGNGGATVYGGTTANVDTCLNVSGSNRISGSLQYVQR